jgi:prepilin-type N-terminal cleavage/methylation domain-containing protein
MQHKRQCGFSLIELLMVVAVVLIVAAIAVPKYVSAKMAANEGSAVACMRAITSGFVMYTTTYPSVGYPASLTDLSDGGTPGNCLPSVVPTATAACIIDSNLASGTKSGYTFTYIQDTSSVPSAGYALNADPISRNVTGKRSFFTNVPGIIHWNASASATVSDPSIPM